MVPKCQRCNKKTCEVNYYRKGKTYYRKLCKNCINQDQQSKKLKNQLLKKSGYKKKSRCDRCGFLSKTPEQIYIYYLDKDQLNVSISNLRSYCSNCVIELQHKPIKNHGDLLADF